jgi:hypothetical protein
MKVYCKIEEGVRYMGGVGWEWVIYQSGRKWEIGRSKLFDTPGGALRDLVSVIEWIKENAVEVKK